MPDIVTIDTPAWNPVVRLVTPSFRPANRAPTTFDLLGQLAGRPIANHIHHVTIVGPGCFQYRDIVVRLSPYLRGITLIESDSAEFDRVRAKTAGNPLLTLLPSVPDSLPETDLLVLGDATSMNQVLISLPPEFRRKTKLICAGENPDAADALNTDFVKLAPESGASLSGPALYVNADWHPLAMEPAPSGYTSSTIAAADTPATAAPPRISVLVSTYNSEKYLRACLSDLEAQTIASQLEIIVIDSGSQQNERAIVEDFQTRHSNILYVRTEREPLYTAWNRGVQMATGKYITNANSDDSHRCDALELLAAALDANPAADLAYGDYYNSSVANDLFSAPHIMRRVVHPPYHPATLMFYCVTGCHPMWRRGVFFKIGVFDTQYTAPGDYEFLLRMAQAGLRAVRVPEFLSLFYQNPKGLSYNSAVRSRYEWDLIHAKYRDQMPIERLFAVNPNHPESAALGWIALGNFAMNYRAPWFDNFSQEIDFAIICYERALARAPRQAAALHNLAVARILKGQFDRTEPLLRAMPPPQIDRLISDLKSGNLKIVQVNVRPAVEPLDYYSPGRPDKALGAAPQVAPPKPAPSAAPAPGCTVRWVAPFLSPGEYSRDSINSVLGLAPFLPAFGTLDHTEAFSVGYELELPASVKEAMLATRAKFNFMGGGIAVATSVPNSFFTPGDGLYNIGRTAIEADSVPGDWVTVCNQMREIWVPGNFALEIFARSGVERSKLRVVPTSVDTTAFSPDATVPAGLPGRASWNFLFCDDWSERSGWDVLLNAYFREFSDRDDVCLFIGSRLPGKTCAESADKIRQQTLQVAAAIGSTARFEVLGFPDSDLPRVLQACDCVVLPARGEGWGRNHLQTMLMEKLVITTGWGAHMDFCTEDRSRLIDFKLVEIEPSESDFLPLRGLKWAAPSEEHLRALLRDVQINPAAARARGRGHRAALAAAFDRVQVGRRTATCLSEIEQKLNTASCDPCAPRIVTVEPEDPAKPVADLQITWEGTFLDYGSLSHVNRELTASLAKDNHIQIARVSQRNHSAPPELKNLARSIRTEAPRQASVTVRHAWPPIWQRPAAGAWVLIQPWEFGVIPADWVANLSQVDEVWAPSDYVRRVYVDSGVHPSKVKIVPNGIDPAKFQPGLQPWPLATEKKFKFLFVGGTIRRKGPDLLLAAYLESFTAADDVCLVIKDFGGKSVYEGQTLEKDIAAARANPNAPHILYLTDELPPEAMPRLYAACQCLVHPYRGEGFGLPVLEAMACGLPVVVTAGGATDDFATDGYAYRLPALRKQICDKVGALKLHRKGWWLEPAPGPLAERLRWIFAHPDEARNLGCAASDYVRREWTWERAARIASHRLRDLAVRKKAEVTSLAARRARKAGPITLPAAARIGDLAPARQFLAKKDLAAAWNATSAAIQSRPYHPEGFLLLAEIAKAAGDGPAARRMAQHARNLAPKWNAPGQFLKGKINASGPASQEVSRKFEFDLDTQGPPRLSVCLIVRNEEEFLGRCLASVRDVASQIIVVDTGSTDRTIEIAKEYGAEVHHFAWCDDFSAARNAALEHVTGDWVLSLDADEELLVEHHETLRREMRCAASLAYRIPIINVGREQEGCSYVPRLFRNAPGLFFVGRVHEQVFSSVQVRCQQWGLKNALGQTTLLHHGYTTEVVSNRNKIERNLRLLQLAIEELPNEPNLLMNYGLELVRSGRLQNGLEQYLEALRCLSALPPSEVTPELRETLLTQLTAHLMAARCFEDIVRILQLPIAKAAGLTASQHFSLGLAHMELKQPALAAEQMRYCLARRGQATLSPVNKEILKAGPNHCLALCLSEMKQHDAARQAFEAALADDPLSRPVRFDVARFHAGQGTAIYALKLLNQLVSENPTDARVWEFGGQIALDRPECLDLARKWTAEAVKNHPQNEAIVLQRAEALMLSQDIENAVPLWRRAQSTASPRRSAAVILCEVLLGDRQYQFSGDQEVAISREAVHWYQQWLRVGAHLLLHRLHERIEQIRLVLPSFAKNWEAADRLARPAAA